MGLWHHFLHQHIFVHHQQFIQILHLLGFIIVIISATWNFLQFLQKFWAQKICLYNLMVAHIQMPFWCKMVSSFFPYLCVNVHVSLIFNSCFIGEFMSISCLLFLVVFLSAWICEPLFLGFCFKFFIFESYRFISFVGLIFWFTENSERERLFLCEFNCLWIENREKIEFFSNPNI